MRHFIFWMSVVLVLSSGCATGRQKHFNSASQQKARNVILFIGDGMGISTVTAARVFAAGVDGELAIDRFPYTALSRTYNADYITPDSAGTMTAMITGIKSNMGVLGFGPETERNDFNHDGDGEPLWTAAELAKHHGMLVGIVSTARVTHATPAGCYAHINERNHEDEIILQALPTDATYNTRLRTGIDLMLAGGRQHFIPDDQIDEEGEPGMRKDGRDLRKEFQQAGYTYVWNEQGFDKLSSQDLPVMGLFDASHMKYEFDRHTDQGGEPSLVEMTKKSIELLSHAASKDDTGYMLVIESGRIDHAHHDCNAFRALSDTVELDRAIEAAMAKVNLDETLIIVTADHSHVFAIGGYTLAHSAMLKYKPKSAPEGFAERPYHGILDVVYQLNSYTGAIYVKKDQGGAPFTTVGYLNGPGFRHGAQLDPCTDRTVGFNDVVPAGPNDPNYLQISAVSLAWETHGAEDVAIYAIGPGAHRVHGTVDNTYIFDVICQALGWPDPRTNAE